ncbi:MAG: putative C-S lyase [Candidatus Accumulibacter sp.]|uniref:MalY/PatB family protein n=1 Tax=Accumulibacter sp. TaxID=2053492 RepID=UPI001D82A1F6|nr:PatB family C-S lyase [Accumulibacter sp.]MCB1941197.1 PatB family C-S lyase [Accumulibacter sp.]MCP5247303.1 putative C-S lyase [Accumulibacter sp.]
MDGFDFERVIDRRGGDSVKWNKYAGRDVLPMWVADMDFAAPPAIIEALEKRIAHGCFGYAAPTPALYDAVLGHLRRAYGWRVEADWLVWLPGMVSGLNIACRAVAGDVVTATPIYPPFLSAPRLADRRLTTAELSLSGGRWGWDFAALTAALQPSSRLLLLCHPHNPVGRAWHEHELAEIAAFCKRHELTVCSDEIHCDLLLDEHRQHLPLATIDGDLARHSITLMAPSKTWNIPGLGCAFAVISEAALRRRFIDAMRGIVPHVNVLGLVATEAAYRHGDDWRRALLAVLRSNRDRLAAALSGIPGLRQTHVEATYLAWIDARGLGVDDPAAFFEAAGVGLSNGADFGLPGWLRLNFGCPRTTLDTAIERLRAAAAGSAETAPPT